LVKPIIQFCHRNPSNCIFFHQFNLIISGTSYGRFCFGRISYCVFQIYTLTLSKHIKGGVRLHENSRHIQGLLFVIIGAALWGIGGTAADYIFRHTPVTVDWYVTFRLTASGIILLFAYALFSRKQQPVRMDRKTLGMLFVYSLLGMTMVQYSFMAAIGHGNAAIATVLQYTGPIYIILWLVIRKYSKWSRADGLIIIGMIAGVVLLSTGGDLSRMAVSPAALIWGLVSGVALAY